MPGVKKTPKPVHFFSFQINAGHFYDMRFELDVRGFPAIDNKMEIIHGLIAESVVIINWQVNQIVTIQGGAVPLVSFAVTVSYTGEKLDQESILKKIRDIPN